MVDSEPEPSETTTTKTLDRVVIRFAGDSGDGMQVAGARFTDASASFGNDLATLPSFPAEIRAPAGTLPGVSSFQVQIADFDILTAGDAPDCLVAMNPAALRKNLAELKNGGTLIVNTEAFDERNLAKAGYDKDPLEDGTLDGYRVIKVPMESLTKEAVKDSGVSGRDVLRSKNFFALGLLAWLFNRPTEPTIEWAEKKFRNKPEVAAANIAAFRAGYNFGITTDATRVTFEVKPAKLPPGTYTNITGNIALAWGLIAASQAADLPLFYGTYPITPASDILHELSRHKNFGVKTFQAEDEIAAIASTVGAAFAGNLAVTGSSGPGIALKSEGISLAFMTELPLIVVNVQRAGPSTGMPTKPEQSDLLSAVYGRHGEAPLPVVAAASPSDAFMTAVEAARLALKYMTPVLLLSDNHVANGSEPWRLPDLDELPDISVPFATRPNSEKGFLPYLRDVETFARPWAIPGTPGMEHRLGGLEKDAITGNVSYDPSNHQLMTDTRAWKVANIANDIPPVEVDQAGPEPGDMLVLGWGSTYGSIKAAVRRVRASGARVDQAHLRHLNPFPANLQEVLGRYQRVLVPELNTGHLLRLIRAEYLVPAIGLNKVAGEPFQITEIADRIEELLEKSA
ncbi:MAG TPA: 2-oxoacid:acceptor oxidoreductase subunit alpha [Acidimicrobiia bacterium]|nr:2-oxoacid:acceptor oxidoreductase subunit alpha [Acidimicrobiia bacterium]